MLVEHGAGGTSTRSVAEEAGVPLSLVHYHFGGKQGLLVAVLERENAELLERQRALYAEPGPLAEKWRTACDFLDVDIRSGFVRVLWELWAAGLADEELKAGWRRAIGGWRDLLDVGLRGRGPTSSSLDLPLSPRATATLVADLFHGIEVELLAGRDRGGSAAPRGARRVRRPDRARRGPPRAGACRSPAARCGARGAEPRRLAQGASARPSAGRGRLR